MAMNRLRNRLVAVFLAATTLWLTTYLLQHSLSYNTVAELDHLSEVLKQTGKEHYQHIRETLKADALAGRVKPREFPVSNPPAELREYAQSEEAEHFLLAGEGGNRLDYIVRHGTQLQVYSSPLGNVGMGKVSEEYSHARDVVEKSRGRDLVRGFTYTYLSVMAAIWVASLTLLIFLAGRVSRPIQRLTAGLGKLASGDLSTRVEVSRDDEVGRAMQAFNEMAAKLQESTERMVYLTQLASWQTLARKMAHEVKNSLTPIRLTVEEMVARAPEGGDRLFLEQAAQIVVDEIESLERRIRAFSRFAAEPPVRPVPLHLNAVLEERIGFLRAGHPEIEYQMRLDSAEPIASADEDLVKGILVNLLENAAEAAGQGGRVLGITTAVNGKVALEIHDSGPGLSEQARQSLFQPTISFKKGGMGLGLSIARKSALLQGGEIISVQGELGGAAFRVLLPTAEKCQPNASSSWMTKKT